MLLSIVSSTVDGICRCQAQLAESEAMLRQLREQQRMVKDQHAHGLAQIDMMSSLISLLQLKQQLQASYSSGYSPATAGRQQLGSAGNRGGRVLSGQPHNTNVMVL